MNGFGNVKGEHWLGLKKISCLTSLLPKTNLRIDLADFAGHSKFACYDYFHVGTPSTNYRLTIGGYQNWGIGVAGDSLTRIHSHITMVCSSPLVTETMTEIMVVTVLQAVEEPGGIITVITQTSMGCTSMVGATVLVLHGGISTPLHQLGLHFAIQT